MQQSMPEPVVVRIVEQDPHQQLQHIYLSPEQQHSSARVHCYDQTLQQPIISLSI